ncbi:MAG: hypothetical protein HOP23_11390 [Methylococcaceae bacterium]|nr:hypothetical protein [Methylococcaceae bacterium]
MISYFPISIYLVYLFCSITGALSLLKLNKKSAQVQIVGVQGVLTVTLFLTLFLSGLLQTGIIAILLKRPLMSAGNGLFLLIPLVLSSALIDRPNSLRSYFLKLRTGLYLYKTLSRASKYSILLYSMAMLVLLLLLIIGYPRGFEVTAYHLPIAVNFFRDKTLSVWDHAYMHAYPANMSLWIGFWLQILPEKVVSIVDLPFAIYLSYVVFVLAKMVGSDRNTAILLAIGILSIPIFGFSSIELGSDVAGVACLVAALVLALAGRRNDFYLALVSGLAAGLAYGFKSLHLVGSGLIGMLILLGFARQAEAGIRSWGSLDFGRALLFITGFLILAGPWLLRNWLEFNNPLYPIHFGRVFDFLGFASAPDFSLEERTYTQFEWVKKTLEWFFYPWVEWQFINQNFKHNSGLGAFFALTVPAAWFIWSWIIGMSAWHKFTKSDKPTFYAIWPGFVCYLIGTAIIIVWALLGDRQPRYLMGGIPFLVVLYGTLSNWASSKIKRLGYVMLCLTSTLMMIVLVITFMLRQGGHLQTLTIPTRSDYYEYPKVLDTLPSGAVVGNLAGRVWHYALFGSGLNNHVIPSTRMEELFFRNGHWVLDYDQIHKLGINYLFVEGNIKATSNKCLKLVEIGNIKINPYNKVPLTYPRFVYQLEGECLDDTLIIESVASGN